MKLRIDTIPEEGQALDGPIEPSDIKLDLPGYTLNEPVFFTGHATKTEEDVYVEGRLRGTISAVCSRCLEDVQLPLDLEVSVLFVPKKELADDDNGVVEPESNVAFYIGDTIDLLQELREFILVSLPIKSICRPDCKGLCPSCGANLNVSECDCRERSTGSPFEKLMDLKKRMQGE